ncbi:hypothetical protein NSS70_04610 [Aeribacillus sp. FSL K6-2848]|uniref:hypothetical protein n=1 Tax=Aeribacillus TaxID=1055323 RepID=UPI00119AA82F|nr:hypothetical protein [Aeribacillus composti]TVZ75385.1 hypothetical protein FB379_1587 [Aeribacillus composti]
MRKLFSILAVVFMLFLVGCNSEKTESKTEVDPKEIESRISEALKQMGEKTNLKIISSEENEDGQHVIALSENIHVFIKDNKITLAAMPDTLFAEKEDLNFAFVLLVGIADDSLSYGERNKVVSELGLTDSKNNLMDYTKVNNHNNVQYTYKGDKESILLQAEIK